MKIKDLMRALSRFDEDSEIGIIYKDEIGVMTEHNIDENLILTVDDVCFIVTGDKVGYYSEWRTKTSITI